MNFASDNWSGVAPQINESLITNAVGAAAAYGDSELDKSVRDKFCTIFEKEVAVFFVGTGTIANSLSMAAYSKPGGISLCHREAHMMEDECGAPELFSGGGRLVGVDGALGKLDKHDLKVKLDRFDPNFVHYGQAGAVSLTQASEVGTVYTIDEIKAISDIAKAKSVPVHMDGSRFVNALVHLDTTPAQMTWKSGVDILSFGGTKNGCWCAEAIVLFDLSIADQMAYHHKRAGQLYSKSRFIAAQYDAYLDNGLWLELASHANNMANYLRNGVTKSQNARLGWQTQTNEVFCILPIEKANILRGNGASFYEWHIPASIKDKPQKDECLYRFVTSFATSTEEIDEVIAVLN
jgi:threonine aldolase